MVRYPSVLLLTILHQWVPSRGGDGAATVHVYAFLVTPTVPSRLGIAHRGTTSLLDRCLDHGAAQGERATTTALGAKKKGFAKKAKAPETSSTEDETTVTTVDRSVVASASATPASRIYETDENCGDSSYSSPGTLNAGQKALEKLRRERAEQKDQELRKLRELIKTDAQVQDAPAAIPERVAQRMGQRMLPFVGIPLLGSMATFVGFWYMRSYQNLEVQPSLVATASVFFLVVGLLGITYSVMSASWDEDREGDLLGADEFKKNVDNIKEGLSRSRENALLRERMTGLTDEELQRSFTELEKKESAEAKGRRQSLQTKLEDDLE